MEYNMKPIYNGLFIDSTNFANCKSTLAKKIEFPHCTLQFNGKYTTAFNIHKDLHKEPAMLECFAYGNDGTNEGYLCRVITENTTLKTLCDAVKILHITTSVSLTGKPVNTAKIDFKLIEPFTISATYGVYWSDGRVR